MNELPEVPTEMDALCEYAETLIRRRHEIFQRENQLAPAFNLEIEEKRNVGEYTIERFARLSPTRSQIAIGVYKNGRYLGNIKGYPRAD